MRILCKEAHCLKCIRHIRHFHKNIVTAKLKILLKFVPCLCDNFFHFFIRQAQKVTLITVNMNITVPATFPSCNVANVNFCQYTAVKLLFRLSKYNVPQTKSHTEGLKPSDALKVRHNR